MFVSAVDVKVWSQAPNNGERKNMKKFRGSNDGFTMVEIIAVLVIIGILAAVAAPKFISLAAEARNKAAIAGVSECLATLSVAYNKAYLTKGAQPTRAEVLTAASISVGDVTFGDVVVTVANGTAAGDVDVTTKSVSGTEVTTPETKTWSLPTNT